MPLRMRGMVSTARAEDGTLRLMRERALRSAVAQRSARLQAGLALGIGMAVALLGAACGADAGGPSDDGTTSGADDRSSIETTTAAARPGESADDAAPATDNGDEPGAALAVPSAPSITTPPSEPAPLPSAELDAKRPLLDQLAPTEVVVPPGDCRFEFLGEWVRCENAGWPNVLETDAPDLVSCMQRCLERDDCTAVTDYLWLGTPNLGCYLYLSTCDEPARADSWGEEDGGRDFRRSCETPRAD